jgi:hypothetical protein
MVQVNDELNQLLHGIEMPREFMGAEQKLQKAGMKSATNSQKTGMAGAPESQLPKLKQKKRRDSRLMMENVQHSCPLDVLMGHREPHWIIAM